MHTDVLKRLNLKGEARDWDKAVIQVKGQLPFGLTPDGNTRAEFDERKGVVTLHSNNNVDPFYDQRFDGQQPKECIMEIVVMKAEIASVNFIRYPKIVKPSSIIMSAVHD